MFILASFEFLFPPKKAHLDEGSRELRHKRVQEEKMLVDRRAIKRWIKMLQKRDQINAIRIFFICKLKSLWKFLETVNRLIHFPLH